MSKVWLFVQEDRGATAIEYGIIASMIVIVILGSAAFFGARATLMWNTVATHV